MLLNRNLHHRHRMLLGRNFNYGFTTIHEDDKGDTNVKEGVQRSVTKKKVLKFFVNNGFFTLLTAEETRLRFWDGPPEWNNEAYAYIFIRKGAPEMGRKVRFV